MSQRSSLPLRLFQLFCVLLVGSVFFLLRQECFESEIAGRACLELARGPIQRITNFGVFILNRHWDYALYETEFAAGAIALVLLALLVTRRCTWWAFFYIAAVALAALGELSALTRKPNFTFYYHSGAFTAAFVAFVLMIRRESMTLSKAWIDPERSTAKVSFWEVIVVTAIMLATCVTRFYQLNRLPFGYDGESCPHRLVAETWDRILLQEVGQFVQQSSGMSWVAIHKLFTRLGDPTLYYIDERLLSTAISLLGCLVVYFLMRGVRGPFAAITTLVLYSFGPLDIDWARLPFMHHLPVVLSLLIAWATFHLLHTRAWWGFLALVVLIPCTKFVYPSAKLVSFGPLAAMVGVLLFQRREWHGHLRKFGCVLIGMLLFVGLRSVINYVVWGQIRFVQPFDNPYPSDKIVSQAERVREMLGQSLYFFYEIFYAPVQPTHWTNHAMALPLRSVSSITAVFSVIAFARLLVTFKRPESLVFLAMIGGGLIPGMATGLADRRIAVSIVLCFLLAALELSWFLDVVVARASKILATMYKIAIPVCLMVVLGISQITTFFTRTPGRPIQMQVGDTARSLLKDNTLVVYPAEERRCEMFYSLYDRMKGTDGSIAWATGDDGPHNALDQLRQPRPVLTSWYYTTSELIPQIEILKKRTYWKNYLFIFQPTKERESWRALLKELYPQGKETIVEYPNTNQQRMLFFEVENSPQSSLEPLTR